MAIVQCENNHYYDDSKDSVCPYCIKQGGQDFDISSVNEQTTEYKGAEEYDGGVLTEAYGESPAEEDKTIGVYSVREGNLLTAGWLVCIQGKERGVSHTVYSGRNFAGRSDEMDIVLYDDSAVSRSRHFSVVYEPRENKYYLGEGTGRTYLNGKILIGYREIYENDIIEAGNSKYCFVAFCNEERRWK